MSESPPSGQVRFQTTSWSLIAQAGTDAPEGREAVEKLCGMYWPPLYAFLRGSGRSPTDAEDLLQGFFLYLLEHDVVSYADPQRGRFRTFLIASVKQFLSREHLRDNAQRRRPAGGLLSLDFGVTEEMFNRRRHADASPEALFDRVWAFTLLDQTRQVLRDEYVRVGKTELFDTLSPALTSESACSTRDVAAQLQMSEGAVRVAVHRLRQRYGAILRRHIGATLRDAGEIDDELRSLMQAIGR